MTPNKDDNNHNDNNNNNNRKLLDMQSCSSQIIRGVFRGGRTAPPLNSANIRPNADCLLVV